MRLKENVGGGELRRRRLEVAKKVRWKKRKLTRRRSASEKVEKGEREKAKEMRWRRRGKKGERKREAVGIFARERAREGKRGENKLKAKLYSHKKMELFLDAVPPRYEEKEG